MNLLFAYLLSATGIFVPSKRIQWLFVIASILVFLIFSAHYTIGGDYKSLQLRADNTLYGNFSWNTDLVFEIFVQVSKALEIDVPIIYSLCILIFLNYRIEKTAITLFVLVLSFYLLIKGFKRQALSALVLMNLLRFKSKNLKIFGFIISFLIHKSVIILLGISIIAYKIRSIYLILLIGTSIFLMILTMEAVFKDTFLYHYLEYYFNAQMTSSGAYLRVIVLIIVYVILLFNRKMDRDAWSSSFEITILVAILMIIYGSSTAGDRILIFSIASLIFSKIVSNSSEFRLALSSLPFIVMTMFWVYLSPQAQAHW